MSHQFKFEKVKTSVFNIYYMFKIIIIYEIIFFLFWNVIYFGADLRDFAKSDSLAFIYFILSSMALGWVVVTVIRLSFGTIPDPREVNKKK